MKVSLILCCQNSRWNMHIVHIHTHTNTRHMQLFHDNSSMAICYGILHIGFLFILFHDFCKCVYGKFYIGNLISVVGPMQTASALNGHLSHFHFGFWYVCTKHTVLYVCMCVPVHSNLNAVAIAIPMVIIHFI